MTLADLLASALADALRDPRVASALAEVLGSTRPANAMVASGPVKMRDAANALGISVATLRRHVAAGLPLASSAPKRIDIDEARAWLRERPAGPVRKSAPVDIDDDVLSKLLASRGLRVVA